MEQRNISYIAKLNQWLWPVLSFIFRIEVQGLEHIQSRKMLLIANHNSGALIESHSLLLLLFQRGIKVFGLNHQALFSIPFVGAHFRKIGAIEASRERANEVLSKSLPLLIFPGGNQQAFRPYSQRHQNSFPWARGWAKIAVENQAPVVPIKFLGTHGINPILFHSKILSTLLLLPKLLKVTWFPVSLAQIVLASCSYYFSGNIFLSYLVFCFTPLVPLLPQKVKIKIYPPLQPGVDFNDPESLQIKMQVIMDEVDYPSGKKAEYKINALEKFILAHESEKIHYNSQFVFNFTGSIDPQKFLNVTNDWIEQIPYVRSAVSTSFFQPKRFVYHKPWFTAQNIFFFSKNLSQSEMDLFCHKQFDLAFEPAVRFLLQSNGSQHRLIFSCHHSLYDGAGQAYAFECWVKLYNGQKPSTELSQIKTFQYRQIARHIGWKKTIKYLKQNISLQPPRSLKKIATLSAQQSTERKVSTKTLLLKNYSGNLHQDLSKSLIAFERTLKQKDPIFVLIPAGLRWILKLKGTMQNAVVSSSFFIKPEEFNNKAWQEKLDRRLKADLIEANQKFLFGTLLTGFFIPFRKLQNYFTQLDSPHGPTTSSLLFVHAPMPRSYPLPHDWHDVIISARGTLLQSPSVGIIITGQKGKMTLTVEYVESLVSEDKIIQFLHNLEAEFQPPQNKTYELQDNIEQPAL